MTQLAATTSAERIDVPVALFRSLAPIAAAILVALALHLSGWFVGAYTSHVMLDCGIAIIAAVSLTIVNGFTGQFSIGHAAFIAIGSYASAMATYYLLLWRLEPDSIRNLHTTLSTLEQLIGWQPLMMAGACLVGGVFAAIAGWLVGLPSLRLKGDYLAIVTLGFGEIVRILLQQSGKQIDSTAAFHDAHWYGAILPPALNGARSFSDMPKLTNLFWTYLFVGATVLVAYRVKISSYGRALLSIREDEIAAEAMGINTARLKIRAFVLAAFLAGIAGGLYAHEPGTNLQPTDAGFARSFEIVMMVVLGGLGSISGSVLAAILIVTAGEWLRAPTHVWHVGLGLIAIRGIFGSLDIFYPRKTTVRACLTLAIVAAAIELVRWLAIENDVNLGDYRMIIFALMLILMMIFRPKGLFGLSEIWEWLSPRKHGVTEGSKI